MNDTRFARIKIVRMQRRIQNELEKAPHFELPYDQISAALSNRYFDFERLKNREQLDLLRNLFLCGVKWAERRRLVRFFSKALK